MGLRGKGALALSAMTLDEEGPVSIAAKTWMDPAKSAIERVKLFIESRKLTQAPHAGKPFLLEPFQHAIVEGIYREVDGSRPVTTALLTMGRKNGKTELAAVLAAAHLYGPMAEARGEVYSAASDRNQAAKIFRELEALIVADPDSRARCNIQRFAKKIEVMAGPGSGSIYEALSSDVRKAHSLNPSFIVCDEPAQWPTRELYDNLVTGTGTRETPLTVIIGTQSDDPSHFFSELIADGEKVMSGEVDDPSFFAAIFTTPLDADIWDETTWYASNPALGQFKLLKDMRKHANNAKRIASSEASFRLLHLNQPVSVNSAPLIPREEWMACQCEETIQPREEIYLAIDLSKINDLSAVVACSAHNGDRLKAWHWKPGDLVKEHADRDRAPYVQWVNQGWLEAPPGKSIDFAYIAKRVAEIHSTYKILGVAYDRWRMDDFIRELQEIGVDCYKEGKEQSRAGALRLVQWGQGFADMAPAVDAFEASVLNSRLKQDGNPVLAMCVANAQVIMDPAGNRKLDKSATRYRIDGAVATAMAIGLKSRQPKEQKKYQFFVLGGSQPVLTR